MDTTKVKSLTPIHKCDNCGSTWVSSSLLPIKDLSQRVDDNGPMPSGECPGCHALCYLEERQQYRVTIEERIVRTHSFVIVGNSFEDAARTAEKACNKLEDYTESTNSVEDTEVLSIEKVIT